VHHQLTRCLADIQVQSQDQPTLATFVAHLEQTTQSYAPGLFHSYDIPDLPRTNNDRESEFRDFTRRLLMTTGQQGATRRLTRSERSGAWELIPHPTSVAATVSALAHVEPAEFQQERERVRTHRRRFRLHTRSAPQAQKQLQRLQERWLSLPGSDPPV
jgi:hypothetical protein